MYYPPELGRWVKRSAHRCNFCDSAPLGGMLCPRKSFPQFTAPYGLYRCAIRLTRVGALPQGQVMPRLRRVVQSRETLWRIIPNTLP